MQEVAFWLNLENALKKINQQCEGDGVRLTMDILNHAKRFHATASFAANAGLKERIQTASNYNTFMRDLPLNDLISATSIDAIHQALMRILNGLKKVRNSDYPASRVNSFVHALSADSVKQFLKASVQ
jgi:dynein heavy chain 1